MLPPGLVRAKVQQRTIIPSLVAPDKPAVKAAAEAVRDLFVQSASEGRRMGDVLAELDALCEERRDHRMVRGLAHLARARCTVESPEGEPTPTALRRAAFAMSAERGPVALDERGAEVSGRPTADQLLAEVGDPHGLTAAEVAERLYADLPSEQRVVEAGVTDAQWLVHRYNVALVQGVLAKATEVQIVLQGAEAPKLRQLFRWVKFHQLLHRVSVDDEGVHIMLDGPMSMFRGSTRYGRSLARFFPAMCLQPGPWRLTATVLWTRANHRKHLEITDEHGLVSHYADTGAYRTRAMEHLLERFPNTNTAWTLEVGQRPLMLGAEVVFPDFVARQDDRVVYLEILGHWRPPDLERRIEAAPLAEAPLVFAVSKRLAGGKTPEVPEHPRVVPFAEVLSPKNLVAAFERVSAGA